MPVMTPFQPLAMMRRRRFNGALSAALLLPAMARATSTGAPVLLGIDGEFGLANSTSAQAVELGVRMAVAERNASGGVLGGRPLEVITRDHRSIPARGIRNIKAFAAMPELVAVFGGRFSPVVLEELPVLQAAGLPFLAVWSSADSIVDNGHEPNLVFRLSLRDSLAMPFMLETAAQRGLRHVGLLLASSSWGRSNLAAAQRHLQGHPVPRVVMTAWYNRLEPSMLRPYEKLLDAGAQAIVLVANDDEAALLVREMMTLPAARRVPIISHWGVTGGRFFKAAGAALRGADFSVVQTFSLHNAAPAPLQRFMATASAFGIRRIDDIESPIGVAQAYDMTHILAKAIDIAGSTQRAAVREALERVPLHEGLIKTYAPPFSPTRHEALGPRELLMARYQGNGTLVPADR